MKTQKSDGGPSSYYDFLPGWVTFNDFMEHKAVTQWGGFALHFKDIGKALCRFGIKEGTSQGYDIRKIIYSGLRLLVMLEGKGAVAKELARLAADPQFQDPDAPVPAPTLEPVFSDGTDLTPWNCSCGRLTPCFVKSCSHPHKEPRP